MPFQASVAASGSAACFSTCGPGIAATGAGAAGVVAALGVLAPGVGTALGVFGAAAAGPPTYARPRSPATAYCLVFALYVRSWPTSDTVAVLTTAPSADSSTIRPLVPSSTSAA